MVLLAYKLHPARARRLVLLNVSDHYTRYKAQLGGAEPPRVLGALLGHTRARAVELCNSFEVPYAADADGVPRLDAASLAQKQEHYKKTFPQLDVVGWYSTGAALLPEDKELQKEWTALTESPVYMLFNPVLGSAVRAELPITLYESELRLMGDVPSLAFAPAAYTLESGEAERVAVDTVATLSDASASGSQLTQHLISVQGAARMLAQRVRLLHTYAAGVAAGTLPADHGLLRQISAMLRQLPAAEPAAFERACMAEVNDTLLLAHLAAMTTGNARLADLAERMAAAHEPKMQRRSVRGGFLS